MSFCSLSSNKSHLLQMRGLKLNILMLIERIKESHLLQMRGLKPYDPINYVHLPPSHLLQMRGLKLEKRKTSWV